MEDMHTELILRRITLVCIAITLVISGAAIIGWLLKWLLLARISPAYIPMPPSSALSFVILSFALLVYARKPESPQAMIFARIGTFLVLLVCFVILIDSFTGMALDIERLLISRPEKFEGVPIGRMSPLTAANFILAGAALLLLLISPAGRQHAKDAAAYAANAVAAVVAAVGLVIVLGYVYGTPLLYGGRIVPVALTSAFAFVFLDVGLIAAAGQHYWPVNAFTGSSVRARLMRVFIPVTIALLLISGWLDIVVFPLTNNHALSELLASVFSVIIISIAISKTTQMIGGDIDRANAERKRAEEALIEQSRVMEAFYKYTITSIVFLDKNFNFIRVNEAYARACQRDASEFPGHNHFEFYPHEENLAIFRKVVETKVPHHAFAKPFSFPDHPEWGVTYWDWTLTPILDNAGEVELLVFSLNDVTERKRAEEKLYEASLYTRSLIEVSLDPLVTISPGGKITDVNKATETVTGITRKQLIGSDFSDYFTEPEKAREGYQQVFRKGFVRDYPLAIRHVSGSITDVLYNAAVYKDAAGNVTGVFAAARDITERKQAEEALTKSETKYRVLFEDAGDYILVISLRDINRPVIIDANNAALRRHGYSREELIGKAIWELDAPGYFEKNIKIVSQIQKPGDSIIFETVHVRKDGSTFPSEVSARLLKIGDEPPFLISIERDITERKKAEEIKIENMRLEAADKAKSEFLANMSHELRTPLNSSIGFSELLKRGVAGELSEKQKHFVDNILTSSQFLLALINDILDLSKIEAGKIDLKPEKMSLHLTVNETLSLIKEKAMKHNVLLKTEFDPELEFIDADKQRFKQILFNLLSNAVKFSKEEGGTVTIRVKKEGDMAKFSVSDTGIGIKEENIGRLFRKFEQLESETGRKYEGTGLGLSITRQLVELHGGRIWAESRYGEGSTFTFLLPLKSKKQEDEEIKSPCR